MGYTKVPPYPDLKERFREYCIRNGYNETNCTRPTVDAVYTELFETYRERIRHKRDSYDAYVFGYYAGKELMQRALDICALTWGPKGYKSFLVFHPTREINAPLYGDRVVEEWYTDKYITPYFEKRLVQKNMACQKGKGPQLLLDLMKQTLHNLWERYGNSFWFFQGDFEGYYDNLSHDWIKKQFEGIDPFAYILFCRTIDSWEETEEDSNKFYREGKEPGKRYGVPKGNLPSQWAGIVNLNEFDHRITSLPGYLDGYRYMDDSAHFFEDKKGCQRCREFTEQYLKENKVGIRLHPRKTKIAPITQGLNFCGWHFTLHDDGHVSVKVRNDRKKLKKQRIKGMQKAYRKGRMTFEEIQTSMTGVFAHYHQGDTKGLRKYIVNRYTFERKEGNGDTTRKHLRDNIRKKKKNRGTKDIPAEPEQSSNM